MSVKSIWIVFAKLKMNFLFVGSSISEFNCFPNLVNEYLLIRKTVKFSSNDKVEPKPHSSYLDYWGLGFQLAFNPHKAKSFFSSTQVARQKK